MRFSKQTVVTSLILFFLSQILFLVNIQFPRTVNFDEFHYVPSAKQFIHLEPNHNWEHPPLGKLLIAAGIQVFGDRPIGWRFMSTLFGSFTLVGVYALALVLLGAQGIALWVTLLTVFNQLLYVQARIGMLDTFMFGFLIWALVGFCASWNVKYTLKESRKLLAFSGLMLGFGTACKWFGIIPWAAILLLIFLVRLLQSWQTTFANPSKEDWYRPNLWRDLRYRDLTITLGVIPIVAYFFTFIPFLFIPGAIHNVFDFFIMQYQMWDGQLRVVSSHPYMSQWTDWATLRRPIWYAFDKENSDKSWVRGVLLLGNPLIMWTGLVAIAICLRDWLRYKNWDAFFIFYFYSVFYACWIIIPRKISFYYYYYPAGMMLSFALGYVFHHLEYGQWAKHKWARWVYLSAAFGLFIYFFPILAGLRIPVNSFRDWMWFSTWI